MRREDFERIVEQALSSLPKKFMGLIDNLVVLVEDEHIPPPLRTGSRGREQVMVLGMYHGVPFTRRGPYYGNLPPDVIVIYQRPIEEICRSEEEVRRKVREIVLHEVGHYFGMTDRELRDIEAED